MTKLKKNNKKIGIITVDGSSNVGNRLQVFAMQKLLSNLGFNPVTFVLPDEYKPTKKLLYKLRVYYLHYNFGILFSRFYQQLFVILKKTTQKNICKEGDCRVGLFMKVTMEQLHDRKFTDTYDFFIAGSDVVWNPYNPFLFDVAFLSFVNKERRLSFSASLGCENIPKFLFKKYVKNMKQMKNISLRESLWQLAELKDVPFSVTLDPTFLVTPSTWISHELKPKAYTPKKFTFVHILDNSVNELDFDHFLDRHSLDKKLVFSNNPKLNAFEFIFMIRRSSFVITNSYHGVIFSIIFNKKFICLRRNTMYKEINFRMVHLLSKFKMLYRLNYALEDFSLNVSSEGYDRSSIDKQIKKSLLYLKQITN